MSFIGLDVRGLPELRKKLEQMPKAVQDTVIDDVSPYIVDLMKSYPPQRSVSRASAFPDATVKIGNTTKAGWFSVRQYRYFFWALKNGRINTPYRRTQKLRTAWKILDKGASSMIVNETPYAQLVMGEGTQNRLSQKIGWVTAEKRFRNRIDKVLQKANAAAKRAIKKLGL